MATKFYSAGSDETQDLSAFSASTGAAASATDQAHTGLRSIKLSTGAGPATATVSRSLVLADTGRRISFWARWTGGLPVADSNFCALVQSGGAATPFALARRTTGVLRGSPSGATAVNGTIVLNDDTWYRIGISFFITNTTTFAFLIYLNGVLELTCNAGTLGLTATSLLRFASNSAGGTSRDTWIDDIAVDDGANSASQTDLGDIRLYAVRAFSNGTTNGFTTQIGSGGSGYGSGHAPQVNELPLSVTNGWSMVGAGAAVTEEYNVEGSTVVGLPPGANIVDTMAYVFASSLLAETAQIIVDGVASNIALTTTNTWFPIFSAKTTYPAGTGADVGIITSTTLTTVNLFECGMVIGVQLTPAQELPAFMQDRNSAMIGAVEY